MGAARSPAGYSAREAASLLGVAPARIHYFVRAGLVAPRRGTHREYRLSFQDLVLLRAAQGLLDGGVPVRRVRRALAHLPAQLPRGRSLSGVRITAEGGQVVVREGSRRWNPESGQALLDFEVAELAAAAAPLAPRLVRSAAEGAEPTTEEWFRLACEVEVTSPAEAIGLYGRVIAADARHQDALLNLGRLLHEQGRLAEAEECYRRALALAPADPVAAYNLGVALEDQGRLADAARAYEAALAGDPENADACYNLAGVHERLGQAGEAVRWLKEARRLAGGAPPRPRGPKA